ncbi:MAG: hypothetical protein HY329_27690 [Chloroflexi bacterium]|nr:hypothetical protein [Chloroflexota bacterium]
MSERNSWRRDAAELRRTLRLAAREARAQIRAAGSRPEGAVNVYHRANVVTAQNVRRATDATVVIGIDDGAIRQSKSRDDADSRS